MKPVLSIENAQVKSLLMAASFTGLFEITHEYPYTLSELNLFYLG
jgi:hypothetical protein